MNKIRYSVVFTVVIGLAGCSSLKIRLPSYDTLLIAETEQNGRACIRQHDIRGYGILEDNVISISASGKKRHYIATTLFQCHSLQTSFAAGFKSHFSELCGGSNDKIITTEESCPIKNIYEFDTREEAFATFKKIEENRNQLKKEAIEAQEATQ